MWSCADFRIFTALMLGLQVTENLACWGFFVVGGGWLVFSCDQLRSLLKNSLLISSLVFIHLPAPGIVRQLTIQVQGFTSLDNF